MGSAATPTGIQRDHFEAVLLLARVSDGVFIVAVFSIFDHTPIIAFLFSMQQSSNWSGNKVNEETREQDPGRVINDNYQGNNDTQQYDKWDMAFQVKILEAAERHVADHEDGSRGGH